MRYLTVALVKGGLADRVMEMFEAISILRGEIKDKASKRLIFVNEDLGVCFFFARASDVPTHVEYGAADIGIMGRDIVLGEGRKFYEVMDLGVGKCRMCACGPESAGEGLEHHKLIRVATKYPNTAKDYSCSQEYQTVEIIKLNGSIELVPIVGLSEVIVDAVKIGPTLRENRPTVLKEVRSLSARMVVNQVGMKTENERITAIIKKFQAYLKENVGRWAQEQS